ncbi:hypothetical protein KI387_005972, partial [Taxus chinensis]
KIVDAFPAGCMERSFRGVFVWFSGNTLVVAAPVNTRDPKAMSHLSRFSQQYSNDLPVQITMGIPKGSTQHDLEILDLETKLQVLSMYLWLSHNFLEETFPYKGKAENMARDI